MTYSNPLWQKLSTYLSARPSATDGQLRQYLVFHCSIGWDPAAQIVADFRNRALQPMAVVIGTPIPVPEPEPEPKPKARKKKAAK